MYSREYPFYSHFLSFCVAFSCVSREKKGSLTNRGESSNSPTYLSFSPGRPEEEEFDQFKVLVWGKEGQSSNMNSQGRNVGRL